MRKVALNAIHKMPGRCQNSLCCFQRFTRFPYVQYAKSFNGKVLFCKFVNGGDAGCGILSDAILLREQTAEKGGRYVRPQTPVATRTGDDKSTAVGYKFHMFNKGNGHFEYVLQVVYNRCDGKPLSMLFYVNNLDTCFYKRFDAGLDISDKKASLEKALAMSKAKAGEFDYVRVDWYTSGDEIGFEEIAFTPGAELMPISPGNI